MPRLLVLVICFFNLLFPLSGFLFDGGDCARFGSYQHLVQLEHVDDCTNIDDAFTRVKHLNDLHPDCIKRALTQLSDRFSSHATMPENCACSGHNQLISYQSNIYGTGDENRHCLHTDSYYKGIYDQFYPDNGNKAPSCRTHHSLWYNLSRVNTEVIAGHRITSCLVDIVYHLNYFFTHNRDRCACQKSQTLQTECSQISSYTDLMDIKTGNKCLSQNSVWGLLHHLELRNPSCRKTLVNNMYDFFRHQSAHVSCQCSKRFHVQNSGQHLLTGNLDGCRGHDNDYGKLINNLFEQVENAGCSSHQQLWTTLYHISDYGSYDCMSDMIYRAVERYQDAAHDPCVCEETTTTPKTTTTTTPTTTTTTTTKPTTSSTTTSTTTTSTTTIPTTTAPVFKHTCDLHKVITILAHAQIVTHPDAHPCSDVQVGTNEDLVLNACNLTAPTTWTRGVNVMTICSSIPKYTPIASFQSSTGYSYHAEGGEQSGVLLECDTDGNGFKMATQFCEYSPEIIHIRSQDFFQNDADNYYVIV